MFDFGKKKYRQGMVDGAKPFEEKFRKQEEAIREVGNRIDKGLNDIGENIDALYDHLTSKEKAELYNLNTPLKIEDLDEEEAQFLVAALFELSSEIEKPSEYQQKYLRAVLKTLGITQPQVSINLEAIDAISDINAQKAILQTVLEYLHLGDGSWNLTKTQEEFIESFNLSSKNLRDTVNRIEAICSAVGHQGLAEKYGYVAVDTEDMPEESQDEISEESLVELLSNIEASIGGGRVIETENYVVAIHTTSVRSKLFRLEKSSGIVEESYYPHWMPSLEVVCAECCPGVRIINDQIVYRSDYALWMVNFATLNPPQKLLSLSCNLLYDGTWSVTDKWLAYVEENKSGSLKLYSFENKCHVSIDYDGLPLYALTCKIIDDTIYFLGCSRYKNDFFEGAIFSYEIETKKLTRILSCPRFMSYGCYMEICHDNLILTYDGTYHEKCWHIAYASLKEKRPELHQLGQVSRKGLLAQTEFYPDGIVQVNPQQRSDLLFFDFQQATLRCIASRNDGEFSQGHPFARVGNAIYYFDKSSDGTEDLPYMVDLR